MPGDPIGVVVFALAAIMELTAEPLWVMGQINQYVTLKVSSTFCNCAKTSADFTINGWFSLSLSLSLSLSQVIAEGLPQLFRCAVVVSGILISPEWGLGIFCAAQVRDYPSIIKQQSVLSFGLLSILTVTLLSDTFSVTVKPANTVGVLCRLCCHLLRVLLSTLEVT